jgi:hypothetical protein
MKIIKQPKAQMHASADSVDTDASQTANNVTGDAPALARPLSPNLNSEVVATAKRRLISIAQLVIEVQKKVAALLEQLEPLQKFASL